MSGFVGKKQVEKPKYKGVVFDSLDELYFYCWCEELIKKGLLLSFVYQPQSLILCEQTKVNDYKKAYLTKKKKELRHKVCDFELLKEHKYTPDFLINFSPEQFNLIKKSFDLENIKLVPVWRNNGFTLYLDCKPKGFGMKNMDAIFSINRKWVWEKYNIYIHKVFAEVWFNATFAPIFFHLSHKRKSSKYKSIDIFYNNIYGI